MTTAATLALPPLAGPPVVLASIDGRPARLVLDSGAERSVLSGAAVERLGLRLDEWTGTAVRGIGGFERHRDARVAALSVGGIAMARPLGPVRSLPVVPTLHPGVTVDGLLGADLLGGYDIEVTGGGLRVMLHRTEGCNGAGVAAALPWAEASLPSLALRPGLFVVAVSIAGRRLRALVDTGSDISVLDDRAAAALRAPDAPAAAAGQEGTARGVGPASVALRLAAVGPVTVEARDGTAFALGAGPVWVGRLPAIGFDLVLGMDRLRALRLWLSHAARTVFLARLNNTG